VGRVVFPCGWTLDEKTDQLNLYYGAADTVIGLATARFSEVLRRVCDAPAMHHGGTTGPRLREPTDS
jgi:predicted GH43/DUF377 family glycosyl hydrolase